MRTIEDFAPAGRFYVTAELAGLRFFILHHVNYRVAHDKAHELRQKYPQAGWYVSDKRSSCVNGTRRNFRDKYARKPWCK